MRQIEIFYHVYRCGSISEAARELNVSQPSVSKVLRHAEDQLGFDLFRRHKGRLQPTAQADEMFLEVEDIYRRISAFNRSLDNIRNRKGGHLRIGALPSLSLSVGPDLIARMREKDELLSFELTTLHTDEIASALVEKRVDLCIGFGEIVGPRLTNHKVGEGRLVLVSGNPLGDGKGVVNEGVLQGADMIAMSESGPLGHMIAGILRERSIEPNEVAAAHTYHVALSLVRKQIGLAITDQFTAYSHLGAGLQRYKLDDLPSYPVFATALDDHPGIDLVTATISTLEDVIAGLEAGIARLQPPKP